MQKVQIDTASWETLNRLLDEALEMPATALDGWLEDLAPEFDGLKPRLRTLLSRAAQVETGEFLHTLPKFDLGPDDLADAGARADQPGDVIGHYRLVRELGSGGMGVVWLATRTDGLITRPVALKLPHGAWKRAGLAERMAREREILASLAHRNIAHLYDAGLTVDGQPYLAIEYVEGVRIDTFCRPLELRARLQLFAQVADAVAYAHGKLVVHRDLKPANILVTTESQVRLLDFGIAKMLDDGEAKETRFTQMSGRALTPDYASPEQILGQPLTIASDVYSLGVILYELLCGQRPYKLQRDSRGALEDAILQAEPALPSDMVTGLQRKALRGDLDTVVLKALKKQPAERYPTVHALLDDIERYLTSRPVLAQPDSRWYRLKKFVARNTLGVSAASAIFLVLVVGAVVATWQARIAKAETARAEQVQAFIASVFRDADPFQGDGTGLSAVQLLLQAERRLAERADASPQLRVEMLTIIGESLFGLQENKETARVIEAALRVQQSIADPDPSISARLHLALSESREMMGRNDEALAQLAKAFAALNAAELGATPLAVRARLHESALGLATNDFAMTERAANQAIVEATRILGADSSEVAMALMFLSKAYLFTERMPEAVEPARKGLDILLARHDGDYAHPEVIDLAPYYANALIHVGEFETAATLLRTLVGNAERVFGADSMLVGGLVSISVPAELERGDLRAAVDLARRSLVSYLKEARPQTGIHAYRARLLGHSLLAARAGDEAVRELEEAMRLSVAAESRSPAAAASLGLALAHVGRFEEAEQQLRLALTEAEPGTRPHHQAQRHLATLFRLQGRSRESLPLLEQAVAAASVVRMQRNDHATGLVESGLARLELGELARAQEFFDRAEASFNEFQPRFVTPQRADLLIGMARVRMQQREFAAALPLLRKADAYWRDFDPQSRWAGEAALWLGRCHMALGEGADGLDALRRAERLLAGSRIPADAALLKLTRITD